MKRILYILAFIFFGLFGVVNDGWSDSYTITFGNNANSATAISSSVTAATTIASASRTYVNSSPYTVNSGNCYYGGDGKNNIRVGKSGSSAGLSIALSASGQVSASTIVVNCMIMTGNKNTGGTLNVNGTTAQTVPTSANNLTFTINDDIESITLTSSKAVFIYSITVNYTTSETKYTVTYNSNGGTGTMTDNNSPYSSGAAVTVLDNEFVRDGYNFVGWNTLANGNGTNYEEGETFTISANTILYAQWVIKPTPVTGGKVYELVTDVSDLHVDDKIIILDISKEFAMSTVQAKNNREDTRNFRVIMNGAVAVLNDPSDVQIIQLGQSNSHWTLYTGTDGYLYAASSSANHLKSQTLNNTDGEWSISIDADTYEASIISQSTTYTRKVMQYNSGYDLFACYASASQTGLHIFKESSFSDEYTITFVNQLGADSSKTQTSLGSIIALPSSMEICQKCYTDNWELEGWVTSLSSTSPVYTNDYIPTSDVSLYAYYKRGQSQTVEVTEYKKVKSNLTDWSGDYLIAYEPSKFADGRIGGTGTGAIGAQNHVIAPESHMLGDTVIDVTWGDTYNVTLEEISEGSNTYVLKTKDNLYNYYTTNSGTNPNGLTTNANKSTADDYPITVNFVSENDIRITLGGNATGSVFRYNTSGYFRFYHNCGQSPVYLYKKVTVQKPLATEYSTSPECDTAFISTWGTGSISIPQECLPAINPTHVTIKNVEQGTTITERTSLSSTNGEYVISTPNLTDNSCDKMNILIEGEDSLYMIYKVPIFAETSLPESNSECDVVISGNVTSNSDKEFRNVTIYPNNSFNLSAGELTINSLTLRRDNDVVPYFSHNGTLNTNKLYFELRTDGDDWRWLTLPDTFMTSEIKNSSDIELGIYNGDARARTGRTGWMYPDEQEFKPGEGFIFGANLDNRVKKIYKYELNKNILNISEHTIHVSDYGYNLSPLPPTNDLGWNLIGNPFLDIYQTNWASSIKVGKLMQDTVKPWNGKWIVNPETLENQRFIVKRCYDDDPDVIAAGHYRSILLSDGYEIEPFTSFFVQVAESINAIVFSKDQLISRSPALNKKSNNDETFLRVCVGNRKTGCFISNKFTDEYEVNADLESMYPIYQLINGYKLLYSGINDFIINSGVLVYTPSGNLHLDEKTNINDFEEINALYDGHWYDLLHGQTVDVSGSFILQARRKQNTDIPTDINEISICDNIKKFIYNGKVYILRNNEIYDILGEKVK